MPDFNNVKDKFLVQSCEMQAGEKLSSEMFQKAKGRELQETKLQVIYMQPPAPPSPVPEESAETRVTGGQSPRQTGASNGGGAADSWTATSGGARGGRGRQGLRAAAAGARRGADEGEEPRGGPGE